MNKNTSRASVAKQVWKNKEVPVTNTTADVKVNEASTSGLTAQEKETIQIDVAPSSPQSKQASSAKRRFSKEQLVSAMQKNQLNELGLNSRFQVLAEIQEEENTKDDNKEEMHATDSILEVEEETDSEAEMVSVEVLDEKQISEKGLRLSQDDNGIGEKDDSTAMVDERLVASDDEGQKKKVGRPKGSTKAGKSIGPKTRTSARIQSDPASKIYQ
ncbi:OLC1v1016110C1 [Oldenlandia corymbosa var. corymbosa]|uniref:OLC1v1016110C1 n=1 Tax=Oldenlandia corymbosa var. corymbosa TaxID=529605 RepID=A0AAV1E5A8_OLDCO|nr:OLC1v1016110C1 [Oldenlandia corymbosa var. corymbosa]